MRRHDHELPRRRRHDPVRPARRDARRRRARAECCDRLCIADRTLDQTLPPAIAARIGFKIGAHFGPIVASRLGGRSHQHITATGDTVNVSSRLMEVAAQNDVRLALSDTLRDRGGTHGRPAEDRQPCRAPSTQIRGRSGSLTVWLWRERGRTKSDNGAQPRRCGVIGLARACYRSSGGGERSSTSPLAPSKQIERVGLDHERAALALHLRDLFDTAQRDPSGRRVIARRSSST